MFVRSWRFITLVLVALTMGLAFAHTLELPSKMSYDAQFYVTLQNEPPGLYRLFGTVGAFIEVGALLSAVVLSFLVRKRRPALYLTLAATTSLAAALAVWFLFVAPANAEMSTWTATSIPADWTQLRNQWEYSHAARFVLQLLGFGALVLSVLVGTPTEWTRDRGGKT